MIWAEPIGQLDFDTSIFYYDDAFSTGIEIECAGFAGLVRWLWALDSSAKTRNKKDRRGVARCRSDA